MLEDGAITRKMIEGGVIMAAQSTAPVLVTVPNVPILEVGVEYQLSTGPATFTPEDLADAVTAANEDFSIPSPRHKIGHIDPRFNDTSTFDGSPAFGKYVNLRLGENGMVAYADLVGCPKWLADIMPAAFPSRSIEGFWNVQSQAGKEWRFVLSAVAALGVNWPGVTVLEDLPLWYGEDVPEGAVIDEELVAAASAEGGVAVNFRKLMGKSETAASANLDDVRRAFYNEYVEANQDAYWWWIRAVLVDPNELVVEDDESGQLYKMSFEAGAKGEVTFGDPEEVRVEYVPDESRKAAAGFVAAALSVDREVLASFNDRAESGAPDRPANASGGAMDGKLIRQRLGLSETASDDEVESALSELRQLTGEETPISGLPPQQHPGTGDRGNDTVLPAAPPPAGETAESVQNAPLNDPNPAPVEDPGPPTNASAALPPGMVLIDSEMLAQLQQGAQAGLSLAAERQTNTVKSLVSAALMEGRIPPSRVAAWEQYLGTDFEGGKQALAKLQPGLVPLTEVGQTGVSAEGEAMGPAYPEHWLPEVGRASARQAALASGQVADRVRSRVMREEGVR